MPTSVGICLPLSLSPQKRASSAEVIIAQLKQEVQSLQVTYILGRGGSGDGRVRDEGAERREGEGCRGREEGVGREGKGGKEVAGVCDRLFVSQTQLTQASPQSVHQHYEEILRGVREKATFASQNLSAAAAKADHSIR